MTAAWSAGIRAAQASATAAVASAFPYVGLGSAAKVAMDGEAVAAISRSLEQADLGGVAVAGCEGARDAAPVLARSSLSGASTFVYCDPVDGTSNACGGGPRSVSVVTISEHVGALDDMLDDSQAVFSLGSNSTDVSDVFASSHGWYDLVVDHARQQETTTATLNREDNLRLVLEAAGLPAQALRRGSTSGYRPTVAADGILAVGDATVTLPFECDLEVGRVGLVEAQIESTLYSTWAGLLVSRTVARESPDGLAGYVHRYVAAMTSGGRRAMESLFTAAEVRRFRERGLELDAVVRPLSPAMFGPGPSSVTVIAGLTGLADPALGTSTGVLDGARWDPTERRLLVDTITAHGGTATRDSHSIDPATHPALVPRTRHWYDDRAFREAHGDVGGTGQVSA